MMKFLKGEQKCSLFVSRSFKKPHKHSFVKIEKERRRKEKEGEKKKRRKKKRKKQRKE